MVQEKLIIATICCTLYAGMLCIESSEISNSERNWHITQQVHSSTITSESDRFFIDHMRYVQKTFNSEVPEIFRRDFFVARVLNIRKLSPSDNLVGQVFAKDSEVVILGIIDCGREKETQFKVGSTIAFPVNEMRSYWEYLMTLEHGTLFEASSFGDNILISKFGC